MKDSLILFFQPWGVKMDERMHPDIFEIPRIPFHTGPTKVAVRALQTEVDLIKGDQHNLQMPLMLLEPVAEHLLLLAGIGLQAIMYLEALK